MIWFPRWPMVGFLFHVAATLLCMTVVHLRELHVLVDLMVRFLVAVNVAMMTVYQLIIHQRDEREDRQ